jgi:hypothetical protein
LDVARVTLSSYVDFKEFLVLLGVENVLLRSFELNHKLTGGLVELNSRRTGEADSLLHVAGRNNPCSVKSNLLTHNYTSTVNSFGFVLFESINDNRSD